jgi:parallel beta-helix repeat protein
VTSPDDTIADDGALTLREAIVAANTDSDTDTIEFNINGGGAQTITLAGALPVIRETVTIDGSTQPEADGTSLITIDASAVTAFAVMDVRFEAGGSQLRNFNIEIDNVSTTALYLRADNGSVSLENLGISGTGGGIQLLRDGNVVNGVTASTSGVAIWVIASSGNSVQGNYLNHSGTGVAISGAGSGNSIIDNDFSNTKVGIEARDIDSLFVMRENVFADSNMALALWGLENVDLIASADFDIDVGEAPTGMGLFSASNVTIDGFDLSWAGATPTGEGLKIVGGDNNLVRNVMVQNRTTGIVLSGTSNVTVSCSRILNNRVGIAVSGGATTGLILKNNQIQGNTQDGISNATATMVNAENNYWGAANGPSNLGGSGDSYSGNVDADPFLGELPCCVLPTGSVTTMAGVVEVIGTCGDDIILVAAAADGQNLDVTLNGDVHQIPMAGLTEIRARGRAGNDHIELIDLALTSMLDGGDGDDEIIGAHGNDLIFGGLGNDILTGASGNDFLIGGAGSDRMVGSAGHDILVSGEMASSIDEDSLWAFLADWVDGRADDDGTADDALDETLVTDTAFDMLTGGSGADLFIINDGDKITDLKKALKDGDEIRVVS